MKNGSNTVLTKTEDDITKGSVSFVIERTTETNDDIVYEITAEDKSGNQKVTTLTLKIRYLMSMRKTSILAVATRR